MEPLKLIIEWTPGGAINVSGPINDKGTCYAMLELARDEIRDNVDRGQSRILKPNGVELPKVN